MIAASECLRGIFDQQDAVALGDVAERIEIACGPEHVHREDRLRLAGDASLDIDRIEVERVVDLGEHRASHRRR